MVKYISAFVFYFFINSFFAIGQNSSELKLDFITRFAYGNSYEIIYQNSLKDDYGSELKWEIKPLWFMGAALEYGPKEPAKSNGFFGFVSFLAGIPMETGIIEDRDWMAPADPPGSLTLFSSHENKTISALNAELKGGYSFFLLSNFYMKFYFSFAYMNYKFEAWNGYTQYGENNRIAAENNPYKPWDASWEKKAVSGLGMDYAQHWFVFSPGLSVFWTYKRITIDLGIFFSPLLYCYARDNHYLRNPPFLAVSDIAGGIYVKPEFNISYRNNFIGFGISLSYYYINETRGNLEIKERYPSGDKTKEYYNISGAGLNVFDFSAIFSFYL